MKECPLCVRFILIDNPGAKDKKSAGKGYFKGVKYTKKSNLGTVSDEVVKQFSKLLENVNRIWQVCGETQCRVRFYASIQHVIAVDPKGLKSSYESKFFRVSVDGKPVKVKLKHSTPVEDFLKMTNPPSVDLENGGREVEVEREVVLSADSSTDAKSDKKLLKKIRKTYGKKLKLGKSKEKWNILTALGLMIDELAGKKCINVFVVNNVEDNGSEYPGEEKGLASLPGRNILIDTDRIETDGSVLGHELGHNLGLGKPHHADPDNLMHEKEGGGGLSFTQCEKACAGAKSKNLKPAVPSTEALRQIKQKEEARLKAAQDKKLAKEKAAAKAAAKKAEKEKREKRKKEIDVELEKITAKIKKLQKEISDIKDDVRKQVKKMKLKKKHKDAAIKGITETKSKKQTAKIKELKGKVAKLKAERIGL